MVSALAGKTRAVAIDVSNGEVSPDFRQSAQQSIRLFASAIEAPVRQSFHGFEAPLGLDWAKDLDNHQSSDWSLPCPSPKVAKKSPVEGQVIFVIRVIA